jgi:hypothetical protein
MGALHTITLKNSTIHGINNAMDRKNINRGFKKLRGWLDAVSRYFSACNIFSNFPFELKKVAANSIDVAHSISRNISEGYCRRPPEAHKTLDPDTEAMRFLPVFQYYSNIPCRIGNIESL